MNYSEQNALIMPQSHPHMPGHYGHSGNGLIPASKEKSRYSPTTIPKYSTHRQWRILSILISNYCYSRLHETMICSFLLIFVDYIIHLCSNQPENIQPTKMPRVISKKARWLSIISALVFSTAAVERRMDMGHVSGNICCINGGHGWEQGQKTGQMSKLC